MDDIVRDYLLNLVVMRAAFEYYSDWSMPNDNALFVRSQIDAFIDGFVLGQHWRNLQLSLES